jgi:hypothetical protein
MALKCNLTPYGFKVNSLSARMMPDNLRPSRRMAPKSKSSSDPALNPHLVFGGFAVMVIALALAAQILPEILGPLVYGPYGAFANLTLILCVIICERAMRMIVKLRGAGWKKWMPWAIVSALAFIVFADRLHWGLPWMMDTQGWAFTNLAGLFKLSYAGVPESAALELVAAIAAVRIAALLVIIYLALGAFYYVTRLRHIAAHLRNPVMFYGTVSVVTGVVALLLSAGMFPALGGYGALATMIAAGAAMILVSEAVSRINV